jgi:hypothetical protein
MLSIRSQQQRPGIGDPLQGALEVFSFEAGGFETGDKRKPPSRFRRIKTKTDSFRWISSVLS